MNYLTALLAFSAIMIVLTTLATVAVEFVHQLFRKRAKDFEQLLSQLYTDAIEPRLETAGVKVAKEAEGFVQDLIRNPAFNPARRAWYTKVRWLKNFFDTAFDELTTRQFVEQFAQTEAGKKLTKTLHGKKDAKVQELIGTFCYEFERYGEAATAYFKRRARMLSVLVAFILAVSFNIEPFKLYNALSADKTLAEKVIASIDVEQLEAKYHESLQKAADEEAESIQAEYEKVLETIKSESKNLQGLGLPIGLDYFPYCGHETAAEDGKPIDPRCNAVWTSSYTNSTPVLGELLVVGHQFFGATWNRVLTNRTGWEWLISVLIAGGLIGLGAPFWFKTYSFVASLVPGLVRKDGTQERNPEPPVRQGPAASVAPAGGGAGTVAVVQTAADATVTTGAAPSASPAPAAAPAPAEPESTVQLDLGSGNQAGLSRPQLHGIFLNTQRAGTDDSS